jgi:hypothetical protein
VLRGHEAFVIGAIAKALATVITYPLQLAQVKMRASARLLDKVSRMSLKLSSRYWTTSVDLDQSC